MNLQQLQLRVLRREDEPEFRKAVDEFKGADSEWQFAFCYEPGQPFADYVRRLESWTRGEELPGDFVPNTFLVGVVGDAIVGRVSLRHRLNASLERYGGHVGYGVVPSQRRRAYATEMLRQTLPIAASLGLSRLLITCDDDNAASIRVIERNGGVLEGPTTCAGSESPGRRYWIDISAASSREG